jgi:PAS domain S-box-containing protein
VYGDDLVAEYISDEFRSSVKEVLSNALLGVQTDNYQLPLFTKDGMRVELLLNAATRVDGAGAIVGVVGVGQDITAINQSKAELSRVANDLTLVIDTANAPIIGINSSGKVNEWNRKAVEITGFSKEEVIGKDLVRQFITAEFQDSVQEVLQKALGGEETANFEFPLYTKDGRRVEVLLNAATRRGPTGQTVGVVGVGQDITERKNAETRVSQLADDLRLLIDNANAPIIGIDAHGCVNEWNNKAAAITGFTKEEVSGRYLVRDFIIDEYKVAVNGVLQKALGGTETDNFEFPFITKDGRRVEVLLNATTRRDATGKVVGVVGVGQDITELNEGKVELQRVANDLRLLIETANAPIFGIDAQGNVNEWNNKMATITGFSKEDVFGADLVARYISDEFRSSVKEVLSNALLGVQTDNYQLPLFTKDGRRVEVLLNATTRVDAAGAIVGVVGVGQDITAINQSQAELSRVANDLTLVIDNANAPIIGIDSGGMVNEWNRKAVEITGFSKEEAIGKDLVRQFITAEFQDSVREVLQKALGGEGTANFEFPLYTKDGRRVEVLLNAATRRDSTGKTVGVVGVGQDITELNEGKVELQRVANDLKLLIETANAPIFGIDARGNVNEWNRKMAEITGFRKEDVFGADLVARYISDEFQDSVQEVLQKALRGEETDNFEVPLYTKDGRRVEVLLNAATRRGFDGASVGVVGVGQNITELKQEKVEMQRVADDLMRLIDYANAPIFGINKDGQVNEWNRKAVEITGYQKEEVIGQHLVSKFITAEFQDSVQEVLDNALRGKGTDNFEFPLYSRDLKKVEVRISCNHMRIS